MLSVRHLYPFALFDQELGAAANLDVELRYFQSKRQIIVHDHAGVVDWVFRLFVLINNSISHPDQRLGKISDEF